MARRKQSTPPRWVKDAIPKRCCFCGSTVGIEYDHINPALFEDKWTIENTRPLCRKCHREFSHGMKLYGQMEMLHDHGFLVREGMRKAKERGVKFGKKPFDHEKVMRLIAENSTQFVDIYDPDAPLRTESEIMEMAGVKSGCYHKCKRMLLGAMALEAWPYSWPKPKKKRNMPLYDHVVRELRGEGRSKP